MAVASPTGGTHRASRCARARRRDRRAGSGCPAGAGDPLRMSPRIRWQVSSSSRAAAASTTWGFAGLPPAARYPVSSRVALVRSPPVVTWSASARIVKSVLVGDQMIGRHQQDQFVAPAGAKP